MPVNLASLLPDPVQQHLNEFIDELKSLVPENVRAVVLYGGLAKGKALTETSDVNVLILLSSSSLEILDALVGPLTHARRTARIAPMILTDHEFDTAIKAFPVKFHDIEQYHVALLGADPFQGRNVPKDHLQENARQGLVNFSLKLKRFYVDRSERADLLLDGLQELISAAIISFRSILRVISPPVPDKREEVLEAIARATSTEAQPLQTILSIKKGGSLPSGTKAAELYYALLKTVEAASRLIS
jgi:hypothetical protein